MTLSSISDHDVSSEKYLRGKYSICGVGETTYRRRSVESTRSLATWAISNAMTDAGYYAKGILWPNAGLGPEDVDVTGSYDAFKFTTMLQFEDYGFCKKGEGSCRQVKNVEVTANLGWAMPGTGSAMVMAKDHG